MQNVSKWGLSSALTLALLGTGCTRDGKDETPLVPPAPNDAPAPTPTSENAAPLNNYEAKGRSDDVRVAAERAENTMFDLGKPEAQAKFRALSDTKIEGQAALAKIGDRIRISVEVSGDAKGAQNVLLRSTGPCTEQPSVQAGTERKLGEVNLAEGEATLTVRLEKGTLEPRDPDTLLGHALVLTPKEKARDGLTEALACAQIRAE